MGGRGAEWLGLNSVVFYYKNMIWFVSERDNQSIEAQSD